MGVEVVRDNLKKKLRREFQKMGMESFAKKVEMSPGTAWELAFGQRRERAPLDLLITCAQRLGIGVDIQIIDNDSPARLFA